MRQKIYINGRFLQKPVTGTERFAREIVSAMDRVLADQSEAFELVILSPPGTPEPDNLNHIHFKIVGSAQGHIWEQWDLYRASKHGTLLSLTNSGPVLHRNQIVVIHDATPYYKPEDFSFAYRTLHRFLGRMLARTANIATVSNFSQKDLSKILKLPASNIPIIPNGHEHLKDLKPDFSITSRLGVERKPYFLFVGSPIPRKNLDTAIQAFNYLGREDAAFVIVGAANTNVFKGENYNKVMNVIQCGRLRDEEIVGLYQRAQALVFPSLYEGFGIPLLEAMVHQCPVLASDIPACHEVCAQAALYFNPWDSSDCTARMHEILGQANDTRQNLIKKGQERYKSFSWTDSALKILAELKGKNLAA